jgi:purine-binding chemotaxis protein CheW
MRKVMPAVPQRQFVVFGVGGTRLALDVFAVHEVLRAAAVTSVPQAPEWMPGVVDVRGSLVPVVDLRTRFEAEPAGEPGEWRIVLAESEGDRVVFLVDSVSEVIRVDEGRVTPPPPYVAERSAGAFRSMLRLEEAVVAGLEADALLSSEERIELAALVEEMERSVREQAEREQAEREQADAMAAAAEGDAHASGDGEDRPGRETGDVGEDRR